MKFDNFPFIFDEVVAYLDDPTDVVALSATCNQARESIKMWWLREQEQVLPLFWEWNNCKPLKRQHLSSTEGWARHIYPSLVIRDQPLFSTYKGAVLELQNSQHPLHTCPLEVTLEDNSSATAITSIFCGVTVSWRPSYVRIKSFTVQNDCKEDVGPWIGVLKIGGKQEQVVHCERNSPTTVEVTASSSDRYIHYFINPSTSLDSSVSLRLYPMKYVHQQEDSHPKKRSRHI